jgi:small subunit ribosomal protein S17
MGDEQMAKTAVRKPRRTCLGVVLSGKRDKTIRVQVEELTRDTRYSKYLRRRSIMHVHDEKNEAQLRDTVEIAETRPISKSKSWRLVRVVKRFVGGVQADTQAETTA